MDHFGFTKAKIADDRRLRRAQVARTVLPLLFLFGLLLALSPGGKDALRMLQEGNLQGLLDNWLAGGASLTAIVLLATPAVAGAWAGLHFFKHKQ